MSGWKTYVCAAIIGIAAAAKALGWIDSGIYEMIVGFAGSLGLAALRAGVAKSGVDGGRA